MSKIEIAILIIALVIPIVSLFFIKPKLKRRVKVKEEVKKQDESVVKEVPVVKKEEQVTKEDLNDNSLDSDILSYVEYKKKNVTKPKKLEMPPNFKDMTMPYTRKRREIEKKPQSIAEEISNLSPELKAMIIAGVLDKKNYDN